MSMKQPSVRIWYKNPRAVVDGENKPLSRLTTVSHVHGRLSLEIAGRLVPQLGYWGPDDVCFGMWLEQLWQCAQAMEQSRGRHVFDEGEQGQPAFIWEREGDHAYFTIARSELSDGEADPDWQRVQFRPADFITAYRHFHSAFVRELHIAAPGVAGAWLMQFTPESWSAYTPQGVRPQVALHMGWVYVRTFIQSFAFRWVLATLEGWGLGSAMVLLFLGLGDLVHVSGGLYSSVVIGVGMGTSIGFLQWRAGREWFGATSGWMWATILGLGLLIPAWELGGLAEGEGLFVLSLLCGFFVGGPQRMELRSYRRAGWWAAASAVGWWLAYVTVARLTAANPNTSVQRLRSLPGAILGGLVLGVVSALALAWVLRSKRPIADRHRAAAQVDYRLRPLKLKAGTQVILGAPAKPMNSSFVKAITHLVADIPGIAEAHLPQCFAPGVIDPPAQVLVIVIDPGAQEQAVLTALGESLYRTLPAGVRLDVLPLLDTHSLMAAIRNSRCVVKESTTSR